MNYSLGDWVLCEFEVQQITGMEEDRMTSVSDGTGTLSSYDLSDKVFPLTLRNKADSAYFKYLYDKLIKEYNLPGLNYPEIHRKFVSVWKETMQIPDEFRKGRGVLLQEIQEFFSEIVKKIELVQKMEVMDVKIFGR